MTQAKIKDGSLLQLIAASRTVYPDLFASDLEVLNHLFFVIGNGFAWDKGRLVDLFEDEQFTHALKGVVGKDKKLFLDYPAYEEKHRQPDRRVFYPICEFSRIMTMPEDVQSDYLDIGEMLVDTLLANRNEKSQTWWGKKAKKHILKLRDKRGRK